MARGRGGGRGEEGRGGGWREAGGREGEGEGEGKPLQCTQFWFKPKEVHLTPVVAIVNSAGGTSGSNF